MICFSFVRVEQTVKQLWYPIWDSNPEHIDFESIASANWTNWAYCGPSEEIRTPTLTGLKPDVSASWTTEGYFSY